MFRENFVLFLLVTYVFKDVRCATKNIKTETSLLKIYETYKVPLLNTSWEQYGYKLSAVKMHVNDVI